MSRQRPPPGYLSTVSWTHEGETTYKARFVTSLHKPAMFNLVHILTGMRRSGKTFQLFQLITEYKKRWASAHADAHLECPYSSAEHGRNLSSQVLAQALQASEGNRLADDLHELRQHDVNVRNFFPDALVGDLDLRTVAVVEGYGPLEIADRLREL